MQAVLPVRRQSVAQALPGLLNSCSAQHSMLVMSSNCVAFTHVQGVASPLAGQMFFRASLFGAFGSSKRWLATNSDGTMRPLRTADYYKAGAITGFIAAFTEGPIDFYKSQIQV